MDEEWVEMSVVNLVRDNSSVIPEIPLSTQSLRIWACKYKSIAPIAQLRDLRELSIFAVKDDNFEFLAELSKLKYLSLIHAQNLKNVNFLNSLKDLEVLVLATSPSWDVKSKTITVESISPIANLPKLRCLELFGVTNSEKSLRDLLACTNIKFAKFSKYPPAEVDAFYSKTGAVRGNAPDPFS